MDIHALGNPDKESSKAVLALITAKLVTVDGLALSDAFELGQLIQKYGMLCSAEGAMSIMEPFLKRVQDNADKKEPWEKGGTPDAHA